MRQTNLVISLIILVGVAGISSCSQSQTEIKEKARWDSLEQGVIAMYDTLWARRDWELVEEFGKNMEDMLRDTMTFTYPFDSLRNHIRLVESDDKRVRIYWWIDPTSGSWRSYPAIIQSRSPSGQIHVQNAEVFYEENYFPDNAFQGLYHLRDSLYLVLSSKSFSTIMPSQCMFGYVLTDTGLRMAENLFIDPEGDTLMSTIFIDRLWYFENKEKFNNTIPIVTAYDSTTRTISWPGMRNRETGESMNNNVWSDPKIEPSGDTFRLRFNGEYFDVVE